MDSEDKKLKSGRSLEWWIHNFISNYNGKPMKKDSISKNNITVNFLRSDPFENLIKELKKISVTGSLGHQHDSIKVFLNKDLLKGNFSDIEQRNFEGIKIDITNFDDTYELKTRRNVAIPEIRNFIFDCFNEMIKMRQIKHRWWLIYFMKRTDTKAKKGHVCMYYLVLIEINVKDYKNLKDSFEKIVKDVQQMVESVKKTVIKKDEIDDPGILVPVENILVVESLREDVREKDAVIQEKDAVIQEKDALIQEKDAQIAQLQEKLKNIK
jgi:hypothetical protein